MVQIKGLNAHDRPPDSIRQRYKKYQKVPLAEINQDSSVLDLQALDPECLPDGISLAQWRSSEDFRLAFDGFVRGKDKTWQQRHRGPLIENIPVFTHRSISGQHDTIYSPGQSTGVNENHLRTHVSND